MAVYKKIKKNEIKIKPFVGINLFISFDPDKIIKRCNENYSPKIPIFKNMISRPSKKNCF